jgi:PBP1b-binding outer membrane lipoprotein LpoB
MKRILLFGLACVLFVGCAHAPQQEITNAQNAIEAAKAAKAPIFSQEQFKAAQGLVDSALADIRAQNTKSPFSHDYTKAKKMLLEATADAEAAIAAVPANKARIFEGAKALFDKVKATIEESNKSLEALIKKKNKEAVALKAQLNAAAASLPEDISKVSDESLLMTRAVLGKTLTYIESIKTSIEKPNAPKKDVKPALKKGNKKRHR